MLLILPKGFIKNLRVKKQKLINKVISHIKYIKCKIKRVRKNKERKKY